MVVAHVALVQINGFLVFLAPTGALEEVISDLHVSVCVLYAIKL